MKRTHVKESCYYMTSTSISTICDCFGKYSFQQSYQVISYEVIKAPSICVIAHMKESCHVWMSQIVSEGVTLPCDECIDLCRLWLLCGESWHIWRRHITYKAMTMRSIFDMLTHSASYAVFVNGVKYIFVSRVAHIKWIIVVVSCCRYQMSHLAHMNESRHT